MIQKLGIHNLKGTTTDVELTEKIVAIVGPNAGGKTAYVDAIKIGLLGYHPALGKTAAATMQLASSHTMVVDLTLNGQTIHRSWARKGKTVKFETEGEIAWEPSWLDIGAFLGANAKERVRLVSQGKTGGVAAVAEKVGITVKEGYEITWEDIEGYAKLEDANAAAFKVEIKRWEGLLQGSAELDAEEPPAPAADLPAIRDRWRKAGIAAHEAAKKLADLDYQTMTADTHARKVERFAKYVDLPLADNLAGIEMTIQELREAEKGHRAKQADVEKELAEVRGGLKQLEAVEIMDEENRNEAQIEIEEAKTIVAVEVEAMKAKVLSARQTASALHAQCEHAQREFEKARKAVEQFADLKCCPTCKATAPGWKETVMEELKATLGKRQLDANDSAVALDEATEALGTLTRQLEDGIAINQRITAAKELEARIVLSDKKERLIGRMEELSHEAEKLREFSHQDQIDMLTEQAKEIQEAMDAFDKAPRRPTEDEKAEAANAYVEAQREYLRLEHEMKEADTAHQQHQAYLARQKNAREARARLDEAKDNLANAVAKAKEIRAAIQEGISELWGEISTQAATLGNAVHQHEISVNEEGEMGYWEGATWIPFEAMSGSEQLVAAAALQIGIQARPRILIVDELSRMTRISKARFLVWIRNAIEAGELQQAILVDHDAEWWQRADDVQRIAI